MFRPTGTAWTHLNSSMKRLFECTHQTKWPVNMDQVPMCFWTSVQRLFSKQSTDRRPSAHCLTKSRFSRLDRAAPLLTVATVFVQPCDVVMGLFNPSPPERKKETVEKGHHFGLCNVKPEREFLQSHIPVEKCHRELLIPQHAVEMRHQSRFRTTSEEVLDLFSWLNC